jgi:hypothetical protein
MQTGPNDTIDDYLDILQTFFQSSAWRQLPNNERLRIVGKLTHILEVAEKQDLGE